MSTDEATLAAVRGIIPDFGDYWDAEDNLFRNDDGSFSSCGLFAQLSHFIRERFHEIPPASLVQLAQHLEEWLREPLSETAQAIGPCLLENLESEPCSNEFRGYLGDRARSLFEPWRDQ